MRMAASIAGSELFESLRLLQIAARDLKAAAEDPLTSPESFFGRLSEAIDSLGQAKPARPVRCPEEYVRHWEELVADRRDSLEPRAVRYLCWRPEVATDAMFQYYLDRNQCSLNAQSLQGLIRSCHSRWSSQFAASQVVTRVRDHVKEYEGPNRLLQRWKSAPQTILGEQAHEVLGAELTKQSLGLKPFFESWGIADEATPYVQMAVEHATRLCLQQVDRVPLRTFIFKELLPWGQWLPSVWKPVMSQLILLPTRGNAEIIDAITRLVLGDRRLGDPRHPHNHINWIGMDDAACRVEEWLSAADITFFFERVLPKGKDPHGRKAFWLRYAGCPGLVSRPLLNEIDKLRMKLVLREKKEQVSHFGELLGDTSALLLDFGPILVVEFSVAGNGCFVYKRRDGAEIVPDLWVSVPFIKTNLKKPALAVARVVHSVLRFRWQRKGWEDEMEGILARFGIRPVSLE
jgi:hypothetical protein